jgi:hypothetical protein
MSMGRITRYTKARAKKVPAAPVVKPKPGAMPPNLPPPASEGEVPSAVPPVPPAQTSSTPKMVPGDVSTGLNMRKSIKG